MLQSTLQSKPASIHDKDKMKQDEAIGLMYLSLAGGWAMIDMPLVGLLFGIFAIYKLAKAVSA